MISFWIDDIKITVLNSKTAIKIIKAYIKNSKNKNIENYVPNFLTSLDEKERLLITKLCDSFPEPIKTDDLANSIEIESRNLPYLLRHIYKKARYSSIKEKLIIRNSFCENRQPKSDYSASQKLIEMIKKEN